MGRVLYIGNLSSAVDDSQLQALCAPFGSVRRVQVKTNRQTGQSKGFGYVQMGTAAEAQVAMVALSGKAHDGRPLVVNDARAQLKDGGAADGG
jgi:cold-inducible RNA-binding protein